MSRWLVFLLVLFFIAAFLRFDSFLTIAYFFFAVYLLAHAWVRYAAKNLRVRRRFVNRAFLGDQVTVDLLVHQAGWLPVAWLQVDEELPVQLTAARIRPEVISLGPRERRRLSYTLDCRQRGYYSIGPLVMRMGDVLGIARRVVQTSAEPMVVYPRVLPLHKLGLPTRSPLAALPARWPLFEDTARVMGVRDYRPGDSLRHIHWTATASTGRLLVKRYRPAVARETLICLDLDQASYEQRRRYTAAELAIVVAASLANHIAVCEKLPVGLATEAWDPLANERARFFLPPRPERAHLMNLLEVLARVQVAAASPLAEVLRRESVRLAWGTSLAIVTGRAGPALCDTLLHLRRAGFAVALILIDPVDKAGMAFLPGVPVYRVWREADAEALG